MLVTVTCDRRAEPCEVLMFAGECFNCRNQTLKYKCEDEKSLGLLKQIIVLNN